MRNSTHFNLNLVEGTDLFNPLVQDVPNYELIDEQMYKNQCASIGEATELLNGTVHELSREVGDAAMFRFVATSDYRSGDTFTVDGVQVTALLPSGETLGNGAYVINANVLCCLVGTMLTVFVPTGLITTADNALKLDGQSADYYATKAEVTLAQTTANSGVTLAESARTQLGGLSLVRITQSGYDGLTVKDPNTLYIIRG